MSKLEVLEFPLDYAHAMDVNLPYGAQVLCVKYIPALNKPMLYALANPENEREIRKFTIRETNVYVSPDNHVASYVGSYLLEDEFHVFHVFELLERIVPKEVK